jgi:hypothetical protein
MFEVVGFVCAFILNVADVSVSLYTCEPYKGIEQYKIASTERAPIASAISNSAAKSFVKSLPILNDQSLVYHIYTKSICLPLSNSL